MVYRWLTEVGDGNARGTHTCISRSLKVQICMWTVFGTRWVEFWYMYKLYMVGSACFFCSYFHWICSWNTSQYTPTRIQVEYTHWITFEWMVRSIHLINRIRSDECRPPNEMDNDHDCIYRNDDFGWHFWIESSDWYLKRSLLFHCSYIQCTHAHKRPARRQRRSPSVVDKLRHFRDITCHESIYSSQVLSVAIKCSHAKIQKKLDDSSAS